MVARPQAGLPSSMGRGRVAAWWRGGRVLGLFLVERVWLRVWQWGAVYAAFDSPWRVGGGGRVPGASGSGPAWWPVHGPISIVSGAWPQSWTRPGLIFVVSGCRRGHGCAHGARVLKSDPVIVRARGLGPGVTKSPSATRQRPNKRMGGYGTARKAKSTSLATWPRCECSDERSDGTLRRTPVAGRGECVLALILRVSGRGSGREHRARVLRLTPFPRSKPSCANWSAARRVPSAGAARGLPTAEGPWRGRARFQARCSR
ncbi:hypothetical protein BZB76_5195 [Actinomadura pelletieri DSM 43383]|uniref:Uncharacterized protein n=1 Tax=Actinomadura pelletieri DSM 43383 TaxID=1120940 RepID=A0A495QFX2_9ACTN|nr:hypothetical protein BZB76_5195 [Actinomadura pelletieri DSM 43383]